MGVTIDDIRNAVKGLDLDSRPLCIHCSLRSFGQVEGGAASILEGLRAEDCTPLVPTFSYDFLVPAPLGQQPPRNGWDYDQDAGESAGTGLVYTPDFQGIDRDMGALAAAVVSWPGRLRGNHPLNSFSAVGPDALRLISRQGPLEVYGPLKELAAMDGFVILMGVGPQAMTLIHLAEAMAGRRLFRRWANGPSGRPEMVETGGCSDGFGKLEPVLSPLSSTVLVGESFWRVFPARKTLEALAGEIRARPGSTHCGDPSCGRCNDAARGGPILLDGPK